MDRLVSVKSPLPKMPQIGLVLSMLAMLTPISGGYFAAAIILFWVCAKAKNWPASSPEHAQIEHRFVQFTHPINNGIICLVVAHLLSAVFGAFWSPYSQGLAKSLSVGGHLTLKWLALWLVISFGFRVLLRVGWDLNRLVTFFFPAMFIHTIYCLIQRFVGIDWVHGFTAKLPNHRHSYGVYRVSGFMSHPLTLTYNLMLIFFVGIGLYFGQEKRDTYSKAWLGCSILAFLTLIFSGSRFVMLVIPLTFVFAQMCSVKALRKGWRLWLMSLFLVIGALWLEGSVISRFSELFDSSITFESRWPRFTYWRLHWLIFVNNPLFGSTIAGITEASKIYGQQLLSQIEIMNAHNVFLQTLADSGLIGFLGLICFLVQLAFSALMLPRHSVARWSMAWVLVSSLLAAMTQNILRDSEFVQCLWVSLALLQANNAVKGDRLGGDCDNKLI